MQINFKMYELEKTNNTTIMQSFNDACSFLWDGKIEYDKVKSFKFFIAVSILLTGCF